MKIPKLYYATLFSIKNSYYYSISKNINGIIQISGSYSTIHYDKSRDPLRYSTKARRKLKYSYHKKGLIEDHHLIPKEFHNHSLFDNVIFDVGCSNNIYILPSVSYKETIYTNNFDKDKVIYHTCHREYNLFIKEQLNNIQSIQDNERQKYEFILFLHYLRLSFDNNDAFIKSLFYET